VVTNFAFGLFSSAYLASAALILALPVGRPIRMADSCLSFGTQSVTTTSRRFRSAATSRLIKSICRWIAFLAMSRLQAQLLIVGRITAPEKVGSFILEMAKRLSAEHGNSVALPMSRYDIADYLAVSVETVSRALTDLKHRGVIKLSGTRIVRIVDRDALEEGERT